MLRMSGLRVPTSCKNLTGTPPAGGVLSSHRVNAGGYPERSFYEWLRVRGANDLTTGGENPAMRSSLLPVTKYLKKFLPSGRKDRLLGQPLQHTDRESHLFDIVCATEACCGMLLKLLSHLWQQDILQIVGDQFHDLLTGERILVCHARPTLPRVLLRYHAPASTYE